jgi:aromatic ring hydroxylase
MKKINKSLYEDKHPETSTKGTGFKDKEKALDTLKIIKKRDLVYQKQVVNTMYNRAKHHPHQTESMRDAMKVFKTWLDKNN